jgi:hypothetical protein
MPLLLKTDDFMPTAHLQVNIGVVFHADRKQC